MPKLKPSTLPKHCVAAATKQSFVRISGQKIYTGKLDATHKISPEAEKEYRRIISEYLAGQLRSPKQGGITLDELVLRFLNDKEKKVSEAMNVNYKNIADILLSIYSETSAADFTPQHLKTVRQEFVKRGYVRQKVNWRVNLIKSIFKFGVAEGFIPYSVYETLRCLEPIKAGEIDNPESKTRQPVPAEVLEKTIKELSPTFQAVVKIRLATAARPSEILKMRIEDINRSNSDLWEYRLTEHKTKKKTGKDKTLYFAKAEQEIILDVIRDRTEGYVFRPADAIQYDKMRRAASASGKNSRKQPSRLKRDAERAANPKRRYGEYYPSSAYRKAVERACKRAGVKKWSPYQVRHTAGTEIGLKYGIEAAQHVLGHSDIRTTQEHYFHGSDEIAKRVALSRNAEQSEVKPENPAEVPVPTVAPQDNTTEVIKMLAEQVKALTVQNTLLTAVISQKSGLLPLHFQSVPLITDVEKDIIQQ